MEENRQCQATPPDKLEKEIMSESVPKKEREWWAKRKIERLRAESLRYLQDLNDRILECERLEKENKEFKKLHLFLFPRQNYKTTLRANFMKQTRELQRVVSCVKTLDIPAIITAIEHATDNILLMGQVSLLNELQQVIAIAEYKGV